ncbi:uncharacterized protein [Oryza sativa Japonica Group]|uniref:Os06g0648200 protein n=2 Tax=Oryza sativa subsp. japonica TaxID=39947 RepID=Q67WZ1_ORYSJ|nr:uncharacterized protein LOC4341670 [Oryza sativa Japonica Group]XP_025882105.1 uncharacterized protein LOC4341670 [Oryza sativa Japonica Group]XP_025882106.1 uncharacterized protein LOC4341670 [Oryza sativa Japonica Group]XP_025882107.1 uncharacterized protein LOC4341670 [Oryza sativa Japonica Group]BAD37328.1 unknown protein [Oryza sativa Japonica Group]BAF20127.1 Os06g0648200 [Oryza sativa Japonica Group]BAG88818.1 unnamed protein product [Oryza sativa Japonica Group]BAG97674.1 unnamed |eukprot:NP_001058213.1 Os06g0648200 [Oryza sativa Japonica Group]
MEGFLHRRKPTTTMTTTRRRRKMPLLPASLPSSGGRLGSPPSPPPSCASPALARRPPLRQPQMPRAHAAAGDGGPRASASCSGAWPGQRNLTAIDGFPPPFGRHFTVHCLRRSPSIPRASSLAGQYLYFVWNLLALTLASLLDLETAFCHILFPPKCGGSSSAEPHAQRVARRLQHRPFHLR